MTRLHLKSSLGPCLQEGWAQGPPGVPVVDWVFWKLGEGEGEGAHSDMHTCRF